MKANEKKSFATSLFIKIDFIPITHYQLNLDQIENFI